MLKIIFFTLTLNTTISPNETIKYLPSLGLVVAEPYQRPVATEYVLSLRSSMDCKKLELKPQTGPYLEQLLAA